MLTVIIPVVDEAENVSPLWQELTRTADASGYDLQTIFVDDGSTDDTWPVICRLAAEDPRILGIRLRRKFGKAAALSAGFQAAEGDPIVTLDGDGQDDPAEISRLLAKLDEGFDVVSGWKRVRHDPWHKVWPSRVFNWLVSRMTGVHLHDHNCGLKAFRRDVFLRLPYFDQMHRYMPSLIAREGYGVLSEPVDDRLRTTGQSKYTNLGRLAVALSDLPGVMWLNSRYRKPGKVTETGR